jgi:hypothetical protein
LNELQPFDWLILIYSDWIASVGKASDGVVFVMPDRKREAVQEVEIEESVGMKVSK